MSSDEYQGWANRETWAFNLHWQNDQGLYNETLERAREWFDEEDPAWPDGVPVDVVDQVLGEVIVGYWIDQTDPSDEAMRPILRMFRDEVGSWWRIDHAEVGATVRESLGNEDE